MTDREEAGLRGPVKTCGIECDYVYPDKRWVMHTSDAFSPEGNLLERRHRNPDGSQWSILCRYDDGGRILDKVYARGEPSGGEVLTYQYDALGRLDRVIMRSGEDADRVFESFRYEADGTKTQTTYKIPLDDQKRMNTGVAGGSMLHMSIDAVAIMTLFDATGRATRKVLYDVDDRVIRRTTFRYDAQSLLVEEGELIAGRIREDFRNVYRYDAAGNRIGAEMRWGDLGGQRTSFAHNTRGDVTEERIEKTHLLREERRDDQSWTRLFRYQYDDFGNWTERVTETARSNGETSVSMIERRDLAYY